MIGFFPDPYPDELLYSVCARFQALVNYSDPRYVVQELFGTIHARVAVDLPNHLNHLVANLPFGNRYTVDRLIDESTLLPFYSPFMPPERVRSLREQMSGSDGSKIYACAGIIGNTISLPAYLRFCPLCAVKDQEQFGERYWHRPHQVPGVEVCPTHSVFLEKSNVCTKTQGHPSEFVTAEQAIQVTPWRSLDLSDPSHKQLLKLAHDAAWLLNQNSLNCGLQSVRNRYLYLLADRGLATYSGKVHQSQLVQAFKSYYSPNLLKLLQSEIDEESHYNWLSRLVRLSKGNQHPLRHLLLIHFLGHTVETFFYLPSEFNPFGEGPWLCLNPVCPHFQKPQIQECNIKYSKHEKIPTGIFSCKCGFVYTRKDFDYSRKDFNQSITSHSQVSTVKSYGALWEAALKELWEDSSVSLQKIACKLRVSDTTIKKYAVALQLSFPRLGPTKEVKIGAEQLNRLANKQVDVPNQLQNYRNEWLSLLQEYPNANRSVLQSKASRVSCWLRRHDSEWLEVHLPPPRKNNGSPCIDWESRDVQLAEAVRQSAIHLKSATGRPTKITTRAIGRDINKLKLIQTQLNKLPLTAQALDEVLETQEEYRIRFNGWAAECLALHDTGMKCPRCKSDQISKNSPQQHKPNYICEDCNFQFVESDSGHGYSSEVRKYCLNLHVNGLSLRAIARMTGVSATAVSTWVRQATTPLPDAPEFIGNPEIIDTLSRSEISDD